MSIPVFLGFGAAGALLGLAIREEERILGQPASRPRIPPRPRPPRPSRAPVPARPTSGAEVCALASKRDSALDANDVAQAAYWTERLRDVVSRLRGSADDQAVERAISDLCGGRGLGAPPALRPYPLRTEKSPVSRML